MPCNKIPMGKGEVIRFINSSKKRRRKTEKYLRDKKIVGFSSRKETDFYFCPECDAYHATSQVERAGRVRSKKEWRSKKAS